VQAFAADVFSYWTAPAESHLWGRLIRGFPKAEADLFPSATALVLGLIALGTSMRKAWTEATGGMAVRPRLLPLAYALLIGCAVYGALLAVVLSGHGFAQVGPLPLSVRGFGRTASALLVLLAMLVAVSPRIRSFAGAWMGSTIGFANGRPVRLLDVAQAWIHTLGARFRGRRPQGVYERVSGFDGLRVPARCGMLDGVFRSPPARRRSSSGCVTVAG
jgi:hypothetical protein